MGNRLLGDRAVPVWPGEEAMTPDEVRTAIQTLGKPCGFDGYRYTRPNFLTSDQIVLKFLAERELERMESKPVCTCKGCAHAAPYCPVCRKWPEPPPREYYR